jgi:ATP-dependent helicase/nuclease subunit A
LGKKSPVISDLCPIKPPRDLSTTTQLPITILSAGAGSGKTYNLTRRMVAMLSTDVRPQGIVATTFTQKAAAELQERVRTQLLAEGMTQAANDLGSALIGTVHSIGARLLQRFAFEIGVSPLVEVIAEGDGQVLFNESLAQVLSPERIETMNRLSDRLGLTKSTYGNSTYDWRREIRNITDVARANNFSTEVLARSRQRSWDSFAQLLPPVTLTDVLTWQNRLVAQLQQTIAALEANEADTTKTTKETAELLRQMERQLRLRGELHWHEWAKIGKIAPGAKSRDLVVDLIEFVRNHPAHPTFQADVKGFIDEVFDIAAAALNEYEQYKKKRGLIDYTDMETHVSHLLRLPNVREVLAAELDLLLVDEFQDTSPIQLDIFLQLSQLAKYSIWVGDPKQSIYGFRGADPALMQAIVEATGGVHPDNILSKSWRSRPDLVEVSNAIFSKAFEKMPREQVVLEPAFTPEAEQQFWVSRGKKPLDIPLALMHWHFLSADDHKKVPGQPWLDRCIADQVAVMLSRELPFFDKKRRNTNPIRPCDIAILCRDNTACQRMAEALNRVGIAASISQTGLLETPEVRLVIAWLRRIINPYDRLSAAEIKLIAGDISLQDLIHNIGTDPDPATRWQSLDLSLPNDLGSGDRSAAETLDLIINRLDLRRVAARLGHADQRLDNLEQLRHYALEYENNCHRLHTAATIGGFLLWLDRLADRELDRQASGESPDAVHVITYHRSKGLEYPVTICHSLEQNLKDPVWGLHIIPEGPPDLNDILGGRWLRFWVNPYADQIKGTYLHDQLEQSESQATAQRQALEEEARLLYVGITRARDYLVLPTTAKPTKWLNRVFNHGNEDMPTLDPHSDETNFITADLRVIYAQTELIFAEKDHPEAPPRLQTPLFHPQNPSGDDRHHFLPARIDPFRENSPLGEVQLLHDPQSIVSWLTFDKSEEQSVAAVEKTLLGALLSHPNADLKTVIAHQLQVHRAAEWVSVPALTQQVMALRHWAQQQFQPTEWYCAQPVEAELQQRRFVAQADWWLLRTGQPPVIVLFAPFASGMQKWKNIAYSRTQEGYWLRWAVRQTGFADPELWVVFPLEGAVCRC